MHLDYYESILPKGQWAYLQRHMTDLQVQYGTSAIIAAMCENLEANEKGAIVRQMSVAAQAKVRAVRDELERALAEIEPLSGIRQA